MTALIVIDMQCGMLDGDPAPRNVGSLVERINTVGRAVREAGGVVVFIQHHGVPGDGFAPGETGWAILPDLVMERSDRVISKTTCDSFYRTELHEFLSRQRVHELVFSGWATDLCVDTSVRAAASLDYEIVVLTDGHTAADRPHLTAEDVMAHHNHTWKAMLVPKAPIRVLPSAEFSRQLGLRSIGSEDTRES